MKNAQTRDTRLASQNKKVLGGIFGLADFPNPDATAPWFLPADAQLLFNGRSCLYHLIDLLKPGCTWFPSYLCEAQLYATDGLPTELKFYEIGKDTRTTNLQWLAEVQPGDLVSITDYFGFPPEEGLATKIKERGAWVVEDAALSLLSRHVDPDSDFILYSVRKYLGVPDGGILISQCDTSFDAESLSPPPDNLWLKSLRLSILRRDYDQHGCTPNWYPFQQELARHPACGNYAMSQLTRLLLHSAFCYEQIARQRKDNYDCLQQQFADYSFLGELPETVVPLGFLLEHPECNGLRQDLFRESIYPHTYWPIPEQLPSEYRSSRYFHDNVMLIPCDQRYDHEDMQRVAYLLKEYIS